MYIARERGVLGDWYEQRLELIDEMHEISKRVAKMRLLGRANWGKEDYELAYAIKNGHLQIPTGALWDPKSYEFDPDVTSAIKRGLFNPRRWHSWKDPKTEKRQNDPFPDLPSAVSRPTTGNRFLWPVADMDTLVKKSVVGK